MELEVALKRPLSAELLSQYQEKMLERKKPVIQPVGMTGFLFDTRRI